MSQQHGPDPFWAVVRSVRHSRTSRGQWQRLFGSRFDQVAAWFEPTDRYARRVPKPNDNHGWLRVEEDQPGVFVAVDESRGRIVDVDRRDMAIHEFAFGRLQHTLCQTFQFGPTGIHDLTRPALQIGCDRPRSGFSFPVYLQRGQLGDAILEVADVSDGPSLLFAWTDVPTNVSDRRRVESASIEVITLQEVAWIDDGGELRFANCVSERVTEFRKQHLPEIATVNTPAGFPTPADARWSDVKIKFMDAHSVHVEVSGVTSRLVYTEMGMSDKRSGRPNKQWELLYALARSHGLLTWDSPDARRENKKRRKFLSETLRSFFRIDGEPIELTADKKGYQTVFRVDPD